MKTIGFPISHKENENRRAILPEDIVNISNSNFLYFEEGYGKVLGIDDLEYKKTGCIVCSREEVLKKDVIVDPKVGDGDYLNKLCNQTIFGWVHATQNKDITNILINNKITVFAWEKMFEKGRHVFWRNNELAGEAAVLHAFQCYGKMPYETSVAVLGRGNTARGAIKVLNMLGAKVMQYDRRTENLFKDEIDKFDVIVNCILWDVYRKDHIIYKSDLKKMKKNSMIIDVSCDKNGGVETSVPTTLENPIYCVDHVIHYAVDHTPSIYYKTFTKNNSEIVWKYIDELISEDLDDVLKAALIIDGGNIVDQEIIDYQRR
ncbi:N(5)-(carboxyethyl)ornithine synthase [Faecalitalea cylindroides]|uniref:N(5)-(carboxyethyl)ornithine synthase n=1 Tax=Faecalitalea cylindroides TaxID=39483 RepID=UPI0019596755